MGEGRSPKKRGGKRQADAPELLEFRRTSRFEIDLALAWATPRYTDSTKEIWKLLEILRSKQPIPHKYRAHKMKGEWKGWWDCHLDGDFVLIWRYETEVSEAGEECEFVMLAAVGSHAYLGIAKGHK
jgi:mRNA interferase YafQ